MQRLASANLAPPQTVRCAGNCTHQTVPTASPATPGPLAAAGRVLKWAIALVALATVGVAAWGLAESILATNGLIDSFWLLVDGVNQLVRAWARLHPR